MSKLELNDHLDDMMERIMDEDLNADQIELETQRAKSLCKIAEIKLKKEQNLLTAVKMASSGDLSANLERQLLGEKVKRLNE